MHSTRKTYSSPTSSREDVDRACSAASAVAALPLATTWLYRRFLGGMPGAAICRSCLRLLGL